MPCWGNHDPAVGQHGVRRGHDAGGRQLGSPRDEPLPQYVQTWRDPGRLRPFGAGERPRLAIPGVRQRRDGSVRRPEPSAPKAGETIAKIAGSAFAVAYVGLLGSFIIRLRWFNGPYHGILPLAFLVASSKGADTGRTPSDGSPAGTNSGLGSARTRRSKGRSAASFGVAAALITAAVARYLLRVPTLDWAAAAGFGVIVSSAAQFGDLMESLIKRECARKDASAAVPGFGGVLDVIDSLLFAAPVAFAYWLAFGP